MPNSRLVVIRVHNIGNRIAKNIHISAKQAIEVCFEKPTPQKDFQALSESIFELGPGVYWDIMLCLPNQLEQIIPKQVDFEIKYEPGEIYYDQTIHFDSYSWCRRPDDELISTLKSINKSIQKLKKGHLSFNFSYLHHVYAPVPSLADARR